MPKRMLPIMSSITPHGMRIVPVRESAKMSEANIASGKQQSVVYAQKHKPDEKLGKGERDIKMP